MNLFTTSFWADTKTFFPEILEKLDAEQSVKSAFVLGGGDGKFVIPLLEREVFTTTIEMDTIALNGGVVEFPKGNHVWMPGLYENVYLSGFSNKAEIHCNDFLNFETPYRYDLVFTSCSWHYSSNHKTPVRAIVEKMKALVAGNGLLAAEYLMPCGDQKSLHTHYLREGQLRSMFGTEWQVLIDRYSDVFTENPHVNNLEIHQHRMGFFMATLKQKK